MAMEKRNLIENKRTPELGKQGSMDEMEKDAVAAFGKKGAPKPADEHGKD